MKRRLKRISLPAPSTRYRDRSGALALINVVFLLLVFLLVAGTLKPALPPDFEWAETTTKTGVASLSGQFVIDAKGDVWIGSKPASRQDVARLASELASSGEPVKVLADRHTQSKFIGELTAQLREGGLKEITLLTIQAPDQ